MCQAVSRLWPFTRLPCLGDPSGPSLAPQTAEPLAPLFLQPCTGPSRETPRRLPVAPLIPDQRGDGESPVGLRRYERGVGGRRPSHSTENSEEPRLAPLGTGRRTPARGIAERRAGVCYMPPCRHSGRPAKARLNPSAALWRRVSLIIAACLFQSNP